MVDTPGIEEAQIKLLEQLCQACAVSGDEKEVREIVLAEIEAHADEVKVDPLGNLLALRRGSGSNRLRVMVAAHMDEVGLMITGEEKDGIYRFDTVGSLDPRQLAGKPVIVGRDHVPGVIGAKAIHLTTPEERRKTMPVDSLRIDVGIKSEKSVKLGDRATFATSFERLGSGANMSIRARALDDRIGVATLIELVKHAPENIDLRAAFTVQEEIGLRGARVAAHALDADVGIALDSTPAHDLPHWDAEEENARYNTRLGAGAAIYLVDRATLSDPRLIRHFRETGDQAGIPYQLRQPGGGGTDAGSIHKSRAGVPSISVSVPGRYAHTSAGMIRLADWQNTFRLVYTALSRMSPELLEQTKN